MVLRKGQVPLKEREIQKEMVKAEAKVSRVFSKVPRHEDVWVSEVQLHAFLTSALDGVVSFTPRPLYLQGRAPGTHWLGGWVGPRAVLDTVVKRH